MKTKDEINTAAKEHSSFGLYSMTDTSYEKYLSFIEGAKSMQSYADQQKQQIIQIIEDRIAELENASYEKHKSRTKYLREIKELKLILNLYKS